MPEPTAPEATAPEATIPEATAPGATIPEATAPEATIPGATAPEATIPEATAPEPTAPEPTAPEPTAARRWTLLTNHGHVLVFVHRNPDALIREIARTVGITERATLNILRDLEDEGYVTRLHRGRRTHYVVNARRQFRHPAEADHQVGDLLALFG